MTTAEAARERREQGHTVHVTLLPKIKTHIGGPVPELADMIEQVEREGWRFYQTSPTRFGDMLIFRSTS